MIGKFILNMLAVVAEEEERRRRKKKKKLTTSYQKYYPHFHEHLSIFTLLIRQIP
jgi:hypothetical protein